jgi:hypothetical protein
VGEVETRVGFLRDNLIIFTGVFEISFYSEGGVGWNDRAERGTLNVGKEGPSDEQNRDELRREVKILSIQSKLKL